MAAATATSARAAAAVASPAAGLCPRPAAIAAVPKPPATAAANVGTAPGQYPPAAATRPSLAAGPSAAGASRAAAAHPAAALAADTRGLWPDPSPMAAGAGTPAAGATGRQLASAFYCLAPAVHRGPRALPPCPNTAAKSAAAAASPVCPERRKIRHRATEQAGASRAQSQLAAPGSGHPAA